jgi:hypothetical protein
MALDFPSWWEFRKDFNTSCNFPLMAALRVSALLFDVGTSRRLAHLYGCRFLVATDRLPE